MEEVINRASNKKNILLTGASGTVGFEVLKQLLKKDIYSVTAFDVNTSRSRRKLSKFKSQVEVVYGDISKFDDIQAASASQYAVIHLAAIIPPVADDKPDLAERVNVIGTNNLVKALEKNSPDAFLIYSSSISVYGDRLHNPLISTKDNLCPSQGDFYAQTKIDAEQLIDKSNLEWTIFRLCAIMGGHKISKLMFHQPLNTSLEIATPEDTARAFVNALEKKGELVGRVFDLGGGESCRILYKDFLIKSFEIYGLGKFDFPNKTFAEKNFHCDYYKDGNILNNLVNFRRHTLDDYFEKEKAKVFAIQKVVTSIFKRQIKRYLRKQSEPLAAHNTKNQQLMKLFFETTP